MVIEVVVGWVSTSSLGMCSGDALLCSTAPTAETPTLTPTPTRTQILGDDLEELGGAELWADYVSLSDSKYCGKMRVLEILLEMWHRSGSDKVLIFSYSTMMLDIIEKAIQRVGYAPLLPPP
jgi:SNF2 family DNA or RNA helicase